MKAKTIHYLTEEVCPTRDELARMKKPAKFALALSSCLLPCLQKPYLQSHINVLHRHDVRAECACQRGSIGQPYRPRKARRCKCLQPIPNAASSGLRWDGPGQHSGADRRAESSKRTDGLCWRFFHARFLFTGCSLISHHPVKLSRHSFDRVGESAGRLRGDKVGFSEPDGRCQIRGALYEITLPQRKPGQIQDKISGL